MAGLLPTLAFGPFKAGFVTAHSNAAPQSGQQSDRQTTTPASRTWGVAQPSQAPLRNDVVNGTRVFALGAPRQTAPDDSPTALDALEAVRRKRQEELDAASRQDEQDHRDQLRGPVEVKQLSWEEYDALSPQQRAVVDFNGALYNATNADKQAKLKGADDPNVRGSYDQAVAKTFGKGDRGSDTYAPNTMALLSTLGLNDEGGDLDEWLGMGGAVTAGDLETAGEGIGVLTPQAQAVLPLGRRTALQLSDHTGSRLSEVLARGQNLLAASAQQATAWGSTDATRLASSNPAFTGNDQKSQDFAGLFDLAVSPDVGYTYDADGKASLNQDARNQVASSLEQYDYDPNEFRDYMVARLRNYQQQDGAHPGISLTSDPTATSLSLPEIRQIYFPEG